MGGTIKELTSLTISHLHQLLVDKEVSAVGLLEAHLSRIEAVDPVVGAYLRLTSDLATAQAARADKRVRDGHLLRPLEGIPVAIKDVLCVKGVETTAGSKILAGFHPPYEATAVKRLRDAGAVFLGMTNCDEFAMGSSTENSGWHPTHNPWDVDRVPGGSSGGSAAAVAAGEAVYSLGTDTGGSIRQPASLCGVVGLKPTYGRVSRSGLIAFASSLDQIGPFTRSIDDAASVLQAICGPDPRDSTCIDAPLDLSGIGMGVEGMRLGVPKQYFGVPGIEPGVEKAIRTALDVLQDAGAELVEVDLPHTEYGLAAYYIIAPAEASSNLARFDGIKYGQSDPTATNLMETYLRTRRRGFGAEVRRRIMLGTYALSSGYYDAYYLKAQKVRTLIKQDFDGAFEKCDAIV
ncbi:MAG TPA: Asp-tRNA(Asn)/Glu-tRNA(Gln) amidotransferase subunit GatA, partial [Candidatus Dormibacteraeota bacterium]|nr:Asp-tRNA(Asn)/Glu-tRNA(Gln) amidotransferase subunit GatA [Candidatus Dormibacteraeota bacterium]